MLTTVADVIEAVGGTTAAAQLAGVTVPAASNWRERGFIPSRHFPAFAEELARLGKEADWSVFAFKAAEASA